MGINCSVETLLNDDKKVLKLCWLTEELLKIELFYIGQIGCFVSKTKSPFIRECNYSTKSNGFKQKEGWFRLDARNKSLL